MITDILKQIMTDAGCTLVIYEAERLANLYTDKSNYTDIIGLIIQPADIILEVRANAIIEHYNPMLLKVMQQVDLENSADNNEATLSSLLELCKEIIVRLIGSGYFNTITPVVVTRILETEFDANVVGWNIPVELYYLKNEIRKPCE